MPTIRPTKTLNSCTQDFIPYWFMMAHIGMKNFILITVASLNPTEKKLHTKEKLCNKENCQ